MYNFKLDAKEWKKLSEWLDEHNKTCPFYDDGTSLFPKGGAIGGTLSYEFTPTGLGVITVVRCACKGEVNVTDFGMW